MIVDQKEEIEILKKNISINIEMEAEVVIEKNVIIIIVTAHQTTMELHLVKNVHDMKAQDTSMATTGPNL